MNRAALIALFFLAAAARADLQFAQPSQVLGEVKSGAPLVRRFDFVNSGPASVQIVEVRTGCGCVKPRFDPAAEKLPLTIPAGDRRTIVLEVNTLSQPEGEQTWRTTVTWTENDTPKDQELLIRGRVVTEVSVQPASLCIVTDAAIHHDVLLTDRRPKPLTIMAAQVGLPHIKAKLRPAAHESQLHRAYRIVLEVTPDCPEGRYDDTLNIITDDPVYPVIKVPVTVVKRTPQKVKASPDSVWIRMPADQPIPSKLLRIYDGANRPVKVEKVTAEDPAIVCTWAHGADGKAVVKVQVEKDKLNGNQLVSAIQVELSAPERTKLVVPVTYILEGR